MLSREVNMKSKKLFSFLKMAETHSGVSIHLLYRFTLFADSFFFRKQTLIEQT